MARQEMLTCPECGDDLSDGEMPRHMRAEHGRGRQYSDIDLLNEAYAGSDAADKEMAFANPTGKNQYTKGGARKAGPPKLPYRDGGGGLAGKREMKAALKAEAMKYR